MAGEEEVVNRLVTRYEVDSTSVEESVREHQRQQQRMKEISAAERDLEKANFAASLDIQKEKEERHYEAMEGAIRQHYARRLEMVRAGGEEESRLLRQREEDLTRLESQRSEVNEKIEQDQRRFEGLKREGQQALGGIGMGNLLGLASTAGGIAATLQAIESIRESRATAGEVTAAAGLGPEAAFPLAGTLRALGRTTGLGAQGVGRVARQFVPIAPGGEAGGQMIGQMTQQALYGGMATGVDPTAVAKLFTQMRMLENIPIEQLGEKFKGLVDVADRMGVPANDFIQWVTQATDQGRQHNISMEQSTNLVRLFTRELQEGSITIQQVMGVQTAAQRAPEGIQAMIGREIMRRGGPLAETLRAAGLTQPHQLATGFRAMAEGTLITPEGFRRPAGVAEEAQAQEQREKLESVFVEVINGIATKLAGEGASPGATQEAIRRIGVSMRAIDPGTTVVSALELWEAVGRDTRDSTEIMADASKGFGDTTREYTSATELFDEGAKMFRDHVTIHKQAWDAIRSGFEDGVSMFDEAVKKLIGDEEGAENRRREREAAWATEMESGRTPFGPRALGHLAAAYGGGGGIGAGEITGGILRGAQEELMRRRVEQLSITLVNTTGKKIDVDKMTKQSLKDVDSFKRLRPKFTR